MKNMEPAGFTLIELVLYGALLLALGAVALPAIQ